MNQFLTYFTAACCDGCLDGQGPSPWTSAGPDFHLSGGRRRSNAAGRLAEGVALGRRRPVASSGDAWCAAHSSKGESAK
jgi:hypothetical protein